MKLVLTVIGVISIIAGIFTLNDVVGIGYSGIVGGVLLIALACHLNNQERIIEAIEQPKLPQMLYAKTFAPSLVREYFARKGDVLPTKLYSFDSISPSLNGGFDCTLTFFKKSGMRKITATVTATLIFTGDFTKIDNWKVEDED